MASREIIKPDGTKVVQVYQRWYDVLLEGICLGGGFMLMGAVMFFSAPFVAIYCMFYPEYPEPIEQYDTDHPSSARRDLQNPFSP